MKEFSTEQQVYTENIFQEIHMFKKQDISSD